MRVFARNGPVPKFTAGTLDDQAARGDVAEADPPFDVVIESSGGDIRKPKRGRSHDANFAHFRDHLIEIRQGDFEALSSFGETDADDAFGQFAALAHADDSAVQSRGATANGRPHLVAEWIINYPHERIVTVLEIRGHPPQRSLLQSDGNATVRDSVSEINRAIDRIHHPTIFCVRFASDAFLAQQRYIRKFRAQRPFDQFLAADIQLQLDVVLANLVGFFDAVHMAAHQSSRRYSSASRGALRLVQVHACSSIHVGRLDFLIFEAPRILVEIDIVRAPFDVATLKINVIRTHGLLWRSEGLVMIGIGNHTVLIEAAEVEVTNLTLLLGAEGGRVAHREAARI